MHIQDQHHTENANKENGSFNNNTSTNNNDIKVAYSRKNTSNSSQEPEFPALQPQRPQS